MDWSWEAWTGLKWWLWIAFVESPMMGLVIHLVRLFIDDLTGRTHETEMEEPEDL